MSGPDQDALLSARLRVMRIVVLALALGVATFLVIVIVVRQQSGAQPAPDPPLLTYMALGFAALMTVLQAVIPGLMVTSGRRQIARGKWPAAGHGPAPVDDAGKLCALYQVRLIVGAAMAEGAAFFSLIAYLTEGEVATLAAAAFMLVLVLLRFPTRFGLESWLAEQQERLQQDRMSY